MIIELPSTFAYDALSDILSEDFFLPTLSDDEEYDMDGVAHKRQGMVGIKDDMGRAEGERSDAMGKVNAMDSGLLSDAELQYTSTSASESELEPFIDSGLESDAPQQLSAVQTQKKPRSRAVVTFTEQHEREIALHSPGKLLNTPRDSSRRYDYPFPSGTVSSPSDSPGSTPAVSPFLAGTPSPASSSMSVNSINLILSPEVSAPRTTPIPIPVSPSHAQAGQSHSAATSPSSATRAHPKLSKFKPGDGPIPPSLRGRSVVIDGSAISRSLRSLPPTPSGVVSNPLDREGKRSRSQEPESVSGIGNLAVAPPLRKFATAPSTAAIESLTTMFACSQRTPDAALVPLPESPPPLCSNPMQNALSGSTATSSPMLTIIDTEVSFGLPPHASPLQVTLPHSSTPSYSSAPTVMDIHSEDPDLMNIGTAELISLDSDDDIYYDMQEDISPWPSP